MTQPKPKFTPEPRAWNDYQCAARFGKSVGWLSDHEAELLAAGFPNYDPLLDGRDGNAIEAWFDRRSGLGQAANDEQAILEVINGKG